MTSRIGARALAFTLAWVMPLVCLSSTHAQGIRLPEITDPTLPDSLREPLAAGASDSAFAPWQRDIMRHLAGEAPGAGRGGGPQAGSSGGLAWRELLSDEPSRRDTPAMAYDSRRRRVIVFGGYDQSRYRDDLWELSLGGQPNWRRIEACGESPPGRSLHSMIYDPERDRVVIFGGWSHRTVNNRTALHKFNDVWELALSDTPAWSELRSDGPLPEPRAGHQALYDPSGRQMLVVGGEVSDPARSEDVVPYMTQDVWAFALDGPPAWRLLRDHRPEPRVHAAMAVDPIAREVLLVGGPKRPGQLPDDVWSRPLDHDGAWERREIIGDVPNLEDWPQVVYDARRHRLLVFSDEAWALSLTRPMIGTKLSRGPRSIPRLRGSMLVHDVVGDRLVLYGGWDGSRTRREAWQFDLGAGAAAWRPLVPSAAGSFPPPLAYGVAIYDPGRRGMYIHGGWNEAGFRGDMWFLDLTVNRWQHMVSGEAPGSIDGHTAVYDPVEKRMIVFGGNDGVRRNNVWALPLEPVGAWAAIVPGPTPWPEPRFFHAAAFDSARNVMLVFGGIGYNHVTSDDLWELSLEGAPVWSSLPREDAEPDGRCLFAAVLDGDRKIVLFGGYADWISPYLRNDTWSLDLADPRIWRRLAPSGSGPSARDGHSGVYDPGHHRMIVFGGNDGPSRFNEVWSLNLDGRPTWTRLQAAGEQPLPRFLHGATWDQKEERLIVFGGVLQRWLGDVWGLGLRRTPQWELLSRDPRWPPPICGQTLVYDRVRDRMLALFGPKGSVWALSLSGRPQWTMLEAAGTPPSELFLHSAVMDVERDRVVVFGGFLGSRATNETWELRLGPRPEWRKLEPLGGPPHVRDNGAVVYDSRRDRMLLFGGDNDYDDYYNDTWILSLAPPETWTKIVPAGHIPFPRSEGAVILDEVGDRIVIHGGHSYDPRYDEGLVWELPLSGEVRWRELETANPPRWHSRTITVLDPVQRRSLTTGFASPAGRMEEVWELSLSIPERWQILRPEGVAPQARIYSSAAYDARRKRILFWGGWSGTVLDDLWELSLARTPEKADVASAVDISAPLAPGLAPIHPNPAAEQAWVRFTVPRDRAEDRARLSIIDIAGRTVRVLEDRQIRGGTHAVAWDMQDGAGSPVPEGIYFVHLQLGGDRWVRRLAVVK